MPEPHITLREPKEFQAAHDRLTAIVLGEVPNPFPKVPQQVLTTALDVLCWALQHDHNQNFADNLAAMDTFFISRGLVLKDSGKLQVRG